VEHLPFATPPDDALPEGGPEGQPPTDADTRYVRVAVERGLDTEGLTYREGDDPLSVGDRVEVPLGRGNTRTAGLVLQRGGTELLGGYDPAKTKPVARRIGPVLPASLVPLARWIARYYLTPIGMALAAMVPAAVKHSVGQRAVEKIERVPPDERPADAPPKLTPTAKKAWATIENLPAEIFPADPPALVRAAGAANRGPINRLIDAGLLRSIEVRQVRRFGSTDPVLLADNPAPPPALTGDQRRVVDGIDDARRAKPRSACTSSGASRAPARPRSTSTSSSAPSPRTPRARAARSSSSPRSP
jgi:primosomal protein N'